jgi:hypothetical protein
VPNCPDRKVKIESEESEDPRGETRVPKIHVSSSSYDMYPPPHIRNTRVPKIQGEKPEFRRFKGTVKTRVPYPPPHMTCILLLI